MYWNEDDWGKPNNKHFWIEDVKHTNQVPDRDGSGNVVPSDDYILRYAKYNKNDLCDTNFPVSFLILGLVLFKMVENIKFSRQGWVTQFYT